VQAPNISKETYSCWSRINCPIQSTQQDSTPDERFYPVNDRTLQLLNISKYSRKSSKIKRNWSKSLEERGIVSTGIKVGNYWRSSEEIDRFTKESKLVELWNNRNEEERLSHICKNCICHDKCPGFYYEVKSNTDKIISDNPNNDKQFRGNNSPVDPNYDYDNSLVGHDLREVRDNPDFMDSLKRKCMCSSCKRHSNLEVER
jgi:hypothetical protein